MATSYVRDQVERGWNVTVACPSDGDLGYAAREAGATVRWWRASGHGGGLAGEVVRLSRIVAETGPDVVHLHSGKAGLAGRLVVRDRVPTVFQPHAWSFLDSLSGVQRASLRWERYAARWTTELVCVSTTERQLGESLGVHAPTTVLPNGIDLTVLPPGRRPATGSQPARCSGWTTSRPCVCVGALTVQKGQQDLLADWPKVRAQVPDAQLLLVGDGPDRRALERLAEGLPGVTFAGARTDVPTWLAAADVVVIPSRWEGMALVPLEAMACARSVVATDVNGVRRQRPGRRGRDRRAGRRARPGRGRGPPARRPGPGRARGLERTLARRDPPRRDELSSRAGPRLPSAGRRAARSLSPTSAAAARGRTIRRYSAWTSAGSFVEPGPAQQPADRPDPAGDGHRPGGAGASQ